MAINKETARIISNLQMTGLSSKDPVLYDTIRQILFLLDDTITDVSTNTADIVTINAKFAGGKDLANVTGNYKITDMTVVDGLITTLTLAAI